ncbi:MAG TPA: carbonic anhydrase [Thermoanaerobaculia bacterium]|nr:carbonic anhydrase [Thermoanaerobaculia bacterium]
MRKIWVATVLCLLAVSAFAQSADQLWSDLMAGNELFVDGQVVYGGLRSTRTMWATTQRPPVSILSCADSRVPAEIVFQRNLGELFVVRVAGNVDDPFNIASLEYAVDVLKTQMVVVMGHSDCGAVKASLKKPRENTPTPSLYALILRIRKSFPADIDYSDEQLRARTVDNVCYTARQLSANSIINRVPVKTAFYNVATGVVEPLACPTMTAAATPSGHSSR